jgi:hypothetical protein
MIERDNQDNGLTVSQTIAKPHVSRRFVVFTYGDKQEGLVQLSNSLDYLEKAQNFCKAWKSKRTFIYEFVSNGS